MEHVEVNEWGEIVPQPSLLEEMCALHGLMIVGMQPRIVVYSLWVTLALVGHCCWLTLDAPDTTLRTIVLARAVRDWALGRPLAPSQVMIGVNDVRDVFLQCLCLLRIAAVLPRPFMWWQMHRKYQEASRLKSVLQVALSVMRVSENQWFRWNNMLSTCYYFWLAILVVWLTWRWRDPNAERTIFERRLLTHLGLCLLVQMFMFLLKWMVMNHALAHQRDAEVSIHQNRVDGKTTLLSYSEARDQNRVEEDAECIVCFAEFGPSDTLRYLPCGHCFHQKCIDGWLCGKPTRNKCPVCSRVVVKAEHEDDDEFLDYYRSLPQSDRVQLSRFVKIRELNEIS